VAEEYFELGVVVARRRLKGPWESLTWSPVAVLAASPPLQRGALIATNDDDDVIYAGAATLTIHSSQTSHYRDNLSSQRPSVWVAITPDEALPAVSCITVDPYEGEALAEVYAERLEALSMPQIVREALQRFVGDNHVERAFIKRKRT
jgi:hypothetical protein